MELSKKIKEMIKGWEGCRLTAYLCPAKVPTIGYGHTGGVKMGQHITPAEADALFESDIKAFTSKVDQLLGDARLSRHQHDALVSLAYNIGVGALSRSTLLTKVKANPDDPTIRGEFARYVNGGGRVLPGLVKRRTAEANHYFTPDAL